MIHTETQLHSQPGSQVRVPRSCLEPVARRIHTPERSSCTELLSGGAGSGKSEAALALAVLGKRAGRRVAHIPLRVVCAGHPPERTWPVILKEISAQLFDRDNSDSLSALIDGAVDDDDFVELLRRYVLNEMSVPTPCMIVLDDIDHVLDTVMERTFFVNLRFAHNLRAKDDRAGAIDWIFTTTAPESILSRTIDNEAESVFAIANTTVVHDFTREEVDALAQRLESPLQSSEMDVLWEQLGGVPWLITRALNDLDDEQPVEQQLSKLGWWQEHLTEVRKHIVEQSLAETIRRASPDVISYHGLTFAEILRMLQLKIAHCNSKNGLTIRNKAYRDLAKKKPWWR